jgi:hypothetical protein
MKKLSTLLFVTMLVSFSAASSAPSQEGQAGVGVFPEVEVSLIMLYSFLY